MKKLLFLLVMLISILVVGCKKKEVEQPKPKEEWVEVVITDYIIRSYLLNGSKQEKAYLVVDYNGEEYMVETKTDSVMVAYQFPLKSKLEVKKGDLKNVSRN